MHDLEAHPRDVETPLPVQRISNINATCKILHANDRLIIRRADILLTQQRSVMVGPITDQGWGGRPTQNKKAWPRQPSMGHCI